MWKIDYDPDLEATITAMKASGELSAEDQAVIATWIRQVRHHGPESLLKGFWNDHALEGGWGGHRSSAFSNRGRIIYRIFENVITVKVVRITADHNYSPSE